MSLEVPNDPKKAWREKDSAKRAKQHEIKHPIPGMHEWLEKMRSKNEKPEEPNHEGAP